MLRYAQAVIIPIVLGILISYALEPLVGFLERMRIMRALAAAIVLFTVVSAGGVMLYQLRFQAAEIVEQLPEGARRLRRIIEGDRRSVRHRHRASPEGRDRARAGRERGCSGPGVRQRAAGADRRGARARLAVSRLGIAEPGRGRDAGRDDSVPLVLPARVGRSVSPQAGEDRRAVAGEEEDHAADPSGHRPPDRTVPRRPAVHQRARRASRRGWRCDGSASSRRRSGACSPASSTRSPTSGRSS